VGGRREVFPEPLSQTDWRDINRERGQEILRRPNQGREEEPLGKGMKRETKPDRISCLGKKMRGTFNQGP